MPQRIPPTMARSTATKIANIFALDIKKTSKTHDVVAAVHVDGLTGNPRAEIRSQKEPGVANLFHIHVAFHRRAFGMGLVHLAESCNSTGSQGLDGAGRNGVHPDVPRAQAGRQLTYSRLP